MLLVAPDRVLYVIVLGDEVALKRVVERYESNPKKHYVLAGNLRQLLGWTMVGHDRDAREETANFQLLTKIWCLQHDVSHEIVAVVGKYPHVWKTVVQPHPAMSFTETSMKKLLNGSKPHVMGWRRIPAPISWIQLADGTSLVGLGEQPAVVQLHCPMLRAVVPMVEAATILCHSIPYHTMPFHTILCHTIPYHTIPYYAIPCHTIPHHTIPYHAMPYHTMSWHTIRYHLPCHTIATTRSRSLLGQVVQ